MIDGFGIEFNPAPPLDSPQRLCDSSGTMRFVSIPVLVPLLAALAGCTQKPENSRSSPDVVAVVDGFVIRDDELRAALRRQGLGSPGRPDTPAARREALDRLILDRAIISRALEAGYDRDPHVIAKLHELLRDRYESAELERRLTAVSVSDEDVESYYRENLSLFSTEPMIQGAVILVRVAVDADDATREAARERATTALQEARGLDPQVHAFGELASTYSDDGSKEVGGDIGWLTRERSTKSWEPQVIDALFALRKPGDLGPVVETPRGYVLVKLLDVRPAKARSLESRRSYIRRRLKETRQAEARKSFADEVREKSRVWISQKRLESLTLTSPEPR